MLNYLEKWHLPLLAGVFPLLWLILGGYLFQIGLIKHTTKRRIPLVDGIVASLLSGGAGGAIALIPLFVVFKTVKSGMISALIGAGILSAILFFAVGVMTFACLHQKLNFRKVLRITTIPLSAILVGAILVGLMCAVPSISKSRRQLANAKLAKAAGKKMDTLRLALRRNDNNMPASLEELVKRGWAKSEDLTSPLLKGKPLGFFYAKPVIPAGRDHQRKQIILITPPCKALGNKHILALTTKGDLRSIPVDQIDTYLNNGVNAHWLPHKDKIITPVN